MTKGVSNKISFKDIKLAMRRHTAGDWGELETEDKEQNDKAVSEGCRILSAYKSESDVNFWVITEADRSVTTVLLPEEY